MRITIAFLLSTLATAFGQSMLESSAVVAGTTIGSAAGKKVSDGINTSLRRTGSVLDKAAKTGAKSGTSAPATPLLQVGAGVPKTEPPARAAKPVPVARKEKEWVEPRASLELNNVPPPPPRRTGGVQPTKLRATPPVFMSAVVPSVVQTPVEPVNIDLAAIHNGMFRDDVLSMGVPSARITMYEDGHIVEIYQYRNATLSSGTVRLRDGSVWAVETRP